MVIITITKINFMLAKLSLSIIGTHALEARRAALTLGFLCTRITQAVVNFEPHATIDTSVVRQANTESVAFVIQALVSSHRTFVLAKFGSELASLAHKTRFADALEHAQVVHALAVVLARIDRLALVQFMLAVLATESQWALARVAELGHVVLTFAPVLTQAFVAVKRLRVFTRINLTLTGLSLKARIAAAQRLVLELEAFAVGAANVLFAITHMTLIVQFYIVYAHW